MRIVLLHGYGGAPNSGWLPWLKKELESTGNDVQALAMPESDEPRLKAWVSHLRDAIENPNDDIILVGHSLGCPTILRYLETAEGMFRGAVLVAGFYEDLGPDFAAIAHFVDTPMNFDAIRSHCKQFAVLHAEDDKVVPVAFARRLADALDVQLRLTARRGHYSGSNGISEAAEILEEVEKIIEHKK